MKLRVLIADDDLDAHELLRDLLEINVDEVQIDKALDCESLIRKLGEAGLAYDVIMVDYSLESSGGLDAVAAIENQSPGLLRRTVLLNASPDVVSRDPRVRDTPNLRKPFSLDTFSEILTKTCNIS